MTRLRSYIRWQFDDPKCVDALDPLGNIAVIGDDGTIKEECTYLDRFLEVLVAGFQAASAKKSVSIDIVDEPETLAVRVLGDGLELLYAGRRALIQDMDRFGRDLADAVVSFLRQLDAVEATRRQSYASTETLRRFVRSLPSRVRPG